MTHSPIQAHRRLEKRNWKKQRPIDRDTEVYKSLFSQIIDPHTLFVRDPEYRANRHSPFILSLSQKPSLKGKAEPGLTGFLEPTAPVPREAGLWLFRCASRGRTVSSTLYQFTFGSTRTRPHACFGHCVWEQGTSCTVSAMPPCY